MERLKEEEEKLKADKAEAIMKRENYQKMFSIDCELLPTLSLKGKRSSFSLLNSSSRVFSLSTKPVILCLTSFSSSSFD